MSVKELIVDSWKNMLKNNFIIRTILVGLAYFVVYFLFCVVLGIAIAIHPVVALIVAIAAVIVLYPITMAQTKVLLDFFQGRDAEVFGFVPYGFNNIKKMWAILGRKILKMLVIYILIVALIVAAIGYAGYLIYSVANFANTQGAYTPAYSSYDLNTTSTTTDSTLDSTYLDDNSIYSSSDIDWDDVDLSQYGITSSDLDTLKSIDPNQTELTEEQANALTNVFSSPELQEAIGEFFDQYGPEIAKHIAIICAYLLVCFIVYILYIMKSLYYTYAYVCAFEDENLSALEAVEKSEELMRGHRGKFFWTLFLISFLINIVSSLVAQIGNAYLSMVVGLAILILYFPYIQSYTFTFYNKLVGESPVAPAAPAAEPPVSETPPPPPTVEG